MISKLTCVRTTIAVVLVDLTFDRVCVHCYCVLVTQLNCIQYSETFLTTTLRVSEPTAIINTLRVTAVVNGQIGGIHF